jgi:cytochrome P450
VKKVSFDPAIVDGYAAEILAPGGPPAIRIFETRGDRPVSVVFVARHRDVAKVLRDEALFSVCHYDRLFAAVAPPGKCLLMRIPDEARKERYAILDAAAALTPWFKPGSLALEAVCRQRVDDLLSAFRARAAPLEGMRPQFDILGEYGNFAPYLISLNVFGLPGPACWGLIPRLACLVENFPLGRRFTRETGPYLTQFIWSQVVFAQLFAGFENRDAALIALARWATPRFRRHIRDRLKARDPTVDLKGHPTLLSALLSPQVRNAFAAIPEERFVEHVVSLMFELVGTAHVVPGMAFSGVVGRWLQGGEALGEPLGVLAGPALDAFVDESLRLSPPNRFLLRNAAQTTSIGGFAIKKGEYVCALTAGAGMDPGVVHDPHEIRFHRGGADYLHFGPWDGPHHCFGRRIARTMLGEMLLGMTRLADLEPSGPPHAFQGNPVRQMVTFDPGVKP